MPKTVAHRIISTRIDATAMGASVIPDPTSNLNWSDYKGAIHEIFAKNAQKHPDRNCVIETASSQKPERVFTYKQIDQASNVLANHLVRNGVQRGEVVMVYAYRGVDLVVACFGVLKAGATFSVVDPQYPPDRQNIYLDVARPRALIVIRKAVQDAGELPKEVRAFIDSTLDLRTEIPSLELLDDGRLIGGLNSDWTEDVLVEETAEESTVISIPVGPDSTPTLSFTSGSEGRPKGVKGRHFSLAYYFAWMAKTFKLSDKDRFTMLSGIAHDPIQRDMFTPLYLGAQLIVPPPEDITFDRLSTWASQNQVTVTHLTPAMGQILLGNSNEVKVKSLHHAFFVGDLLLKRDCRKLQELAPNVYIINMYGTTETSRAVSYYEIPSKTKNPKYLDLMGDVIPAGKGMLDVQLIVVDREKKERVCDVGEVGEIYVRAGGLAEGYLGDDLAELTRAKFVDNWFVDPQKWAKEDQELVEKSGALEPWRTFYKGPRDRLYRSGDLGRYMESGDVECTGRADDQVKIRGFRIELGEIDTYLAEHELISQNVTLVRRNRDEEQILVSYIVPDMSRWTAWVEATNKDSLSTNAEDISMAGLLKRFRSLSADVREQLKKKLPHYAVPSLFVPMIRLPLTPNGKVDKRALPFPEESDLLAAAADLSPNSSAQTGTEKKLAAIWAKFIPSATAATVPTDVSFFDLGGNSITAQQMLSAVSKTWPGMNLPLSTIFRSPTLKAFSVEIDRAENPVGLRLDAHNEITPTHEQYYSNSTSDLVERLPKTFGKPEFGVSQSLTVFLTGATGFLGAFILRELLNRSQDFKVIALVRARDPNSALERVKQTCEAYGIWTDSWASRIECVNGNLEDEETLGLSKDVWARLQDEVDVVIHNGARVHWVLPYANLKSANVLSTLALIKLCASGKPKQLAFVSSTSAIDTDHYLELSDRVTSSGGKGISEEDDLEGSRQGLPTGYGQSKWVSEHILREAGRRGLKGTIVRPGYVVGDPKLGTTITDDFLIRMLKGCLQLGQRPDISNGINMCPVDHVARVVVAAALEAHPSPLGVCNVATNPRLSFNEFLSSLEIYGYKAPLVDYNTWKSTVEKYVTDDKREEFALLGLYHMVTGDMPASTRAPELNDSNTTRALRIDSARAHQQYSTAPGGGGDVTIKILGVYIAYLVETGFLPAPPKEVKGAKSLPHVEVSETQKKALQKQSGRGSA